MNKRQNGFILYFIWKSIIWSHHLCSCPSGGTAHSLRTSALEEGFIGNQYAVKNYQFLIKAPNDGIPFGEMSLHLS